MKKMYVLFVGVLAVVLFASVANAALIGSVFHDYGNGAGMVDPGGLDDVYSDYVLVGDDGPKGDRFSDTFDLSGLNYDSVDYFDLTISFSGTSSLFRILEDWRVRLGASSTELPVNLVRRTEDSQIFRFDNSIDTFSQMVAAEEFLLWFSEDALFSNDFKLFDAKVDVYGTAATPIPGAVWLLGSGLMGLVGLRRKCSN